MPLHI